MQASVLVHPWPVCPTEVRDGATNAGSMNTIVSTAKFAKRLGDATNLASGTPSVGLLNTGGSNVSASSADVL